jgi:GNAT superfamily N-acetyltransferase
MEKQLAKMMSVKEINNPKDVKEFVMFPFKLYAQNNYWVPPVISEEVASFDVTKNPFLNDSEVSLFLAFKNEEIVGRIAVIVNKTEIFQQGIKKVRFGWFDFIDNTEVFKMLIEKVVEIGQKHELTFMEGPIGFSSMDKIGVITEGFDHIGSMATWYNHPYYQKHYEHLNFNVEKVYLENKFNMSDVHPVNFERISQLIQARYSLKLLNLKKTKELHSYLDEMFDLFNESYSKLESFVPISDEQKKYLTNKFINFIKPEYVMLVVDKDHKIVAFSVVMPSFSEALQKAKGKLFPIGFYHLLKAKYFNKTMEFYLIGVHPDYQRKGVTALIFEGYYNLFKGKNIKNCRRTPELATNKATALIWKHINNVNFKKRCTFSKNLLSE